MNISIFSLFMAFIWSSIFIILGSVLQRRKLIVYMYLFPLLLISVLSILRLFVSVELPFTKVIRSEIVLVKIMRILNKSIFTYKDFSIRIYTIFLLVWIAGIIVFWLKTALNYIHFRKILKHIQIEPEPLDNKIPLSDSTILSSKSVARVKVIQSSLFDTPLLTGIFCPIICLPDIPFTDKELEYILQHELTHYIHKDLWIKLLLNIMYSIFWWNPFLYLLKRDADHLLELKNDLYISSQLSEESRTQYMETILKVVQYQTNIRHQTLFSIGTPLVYSGRGRKIKQRFQSIDSYKPLNKLQKVANWCVCILMLISFLLSFSFIVQPYIDYPPDFGNSEIFMINEGSSYLIDNKDGSYSLYVDGVYLNDIYSITEEPFSSFTIKEEK